MPANVTLIGAEMLSVPGRIFVKGKTVLIENDEEVEYYDRVPSQDGITKCFKIEPVEAVKAPAEFKPPPTASSEEMNSGAKRTRKV